MLQPAREVLKSVQLSVCMYRFCCIADFYDGDTIGFCKHVAVTNKDGIASHSRVLELTTHRAQLIKAASVQSPSAKDQYQCH